MQSARCNTIGKSCGVASSFLEHQLRVWHVVARYAKRLVHCSTCCCESASLIDLVKVLEHIRSSSSVLVFQTFTLVDGQLTALCITVYNCKYRLHYYYV
jgi:IS1 family transposase